MPNVSSRVPVLLVLAVGGVAQAAPTPPIRQRCGCPVRDPAHQAALAATDCDYFATNPTAAYEPTSVLRIPVVVHVVSTTRGQGNLSDTTVQSQIAVLNEDFRALPGGNGAGGHDCRIEFFLATVDPLGQPTTGIVRHTNTAWFQEIGDYWTSTAWDTSRYLNIYTNQPVGALGYVPDLPQGGSVLGTPADRVVLDWSIVGRPPFVFGGDYNLGRTATHEVGHFLGLWHVFESSCGFGSCYTSGDLICDTNPAAGPRTGCAPTAASCGVPEPVTNYMSYSRDSCMTGFTREQARRMRCTLQHYRPLLAQPAAPLATATARQGNGNRNGAYTHQPPRLGRAAQVRVATAGSGAAVAAVYGFLGAATVPFAAGTVLVDTAAPLVLTFPWQANATACTWTWTVPNLLDLLGVAVATQGILIGSGVGFTNAVDLVFGN